jgi:uncharacterized membrane protein
MGLVFIGIFLTSLGASLGADCGGSYPETCSAATYWAVAVWGVCLMIIGFAVMSVKSRPSPPLLIRMPKS